MRLYISIILIFAFASSGLAKAEMVWTTSNVPVEIFTTADLNSVSADQTKCCADSETKNETQKSRCIGDNIIVTAYVPLVAFKFAKQRHSHDIAYCGYVLNERFMRPPIV